MNPPVRYTLGLLALSTNALASQTPARALDDSLFLDSILAVESPKYGVPGAVVAIVRGGRVVAIRGAGWANARTRVPVDADSTVFQLASVSKSVVATTIMRLAERGVLDLDADARQYLRGARVLAVLDAPVTLNQLLTHTAGFDERVVGYGARSLADVRPLDDYLAARLPPRGFPPGSVTAYSNHGYALAALIAERATGFGFADLAEREVFAPLGMAHTSIRQAPGPDIDRTMASAHRCTPTECEPIPRAYRHAYPAGALVSTAPDMARFLIAQLGGAPNGAPRLGEAERHRMHSQHFAHTEDLPGMAYGFFEQAANGERALAHSGGGPGIAALILLVPGRDLGLFIAANGGSGRFGAAVRDAILSRFAPRGQPASVPRPGPQPWMRATSAFAGDYRLTRYAHHSIENLPGLFQGQLHAFTVGDTLRVLGLGAPTESYVRIGELLFRQPDGDRVVGARVDANGRVTHLFGGQSFFGAEFPAAFERLAWYDAPHFLNEALSWLFMVPLLVLVIAWPLAIGVAAFIRRRRRQPSSPVERTVWRPLAVGAAGAVGALAILFGFGFIAASNRAAERGGGDLIYGLPASFARLAWIPWAIVVLALVLVVAAGVAWRRRWWSAAGRVLYTVLAADALLIVALLARWSYLPIRY